MIFDFLFDFLIIFFLVEKNKIEAAEVAEILAEYGIKPHEYGPVVDALTKNPQAWVDFMMK